MIKTVDVFKMLIPIGNMKMENFIYKIKAKDLPEFPPPPKKKINQ